jgi:CBS domain-containing protein
MAQRLREAVGGAAWRFGARELQKVKKVELGESEVRTMDVRNRVVVARLRRYGAGVPLRFEGISERRVALAKVPARRLARGTVPPEGAAVECPRSARTIELAACSDCRHFVNVRPEPEQARVALRCLVTDEDIVEGIAAASSTWQAVPPDLPVAAARVISAGRDKRVFVVVDAGVALGVVYREHLVGDGLMRSCMVDTPWAIPKTATIGLAVSALAELGVPALVVVGAAHELVGIVTRADLVRVGVPDEVLPRCCPGGDAAFPCDCLRGA